MSATELDDAIAALQRIISSPEPLTATERELVSRFLGGLDHILAAEPHMGIRVRQALLGYSRGS